MTPVDEAIADLNKRYGAGSVMRLSDRPQDGWDAISTGALTLDIALGIGGLPRGLVTEIYGPPSSGKSTLAMHVVAEAQRRGLNAAYIDAEHALDPVYAEAIGVKTGDLILSQPSNGEMGLEVALSLIKTGEVGIVVIDSVAAMTPRAILEGDFGDAHVGLAARMWSQAMAKMVKDISRSKTAVILINQLREKIGVMFGNPEVTTGGKAIPFYAGVRLDVRRKEAEKENGEIIGNLTKVKVVKSKVAPPFKEAEFRIEFGKGIDSAGCLLDVAVRMNLVNKSGAWYTCGDAKMGQGRSAASTWLEENAEEAQHIRAIITDTLGF